MNYGFTTWPERQFYWEAMPQMSNSLNHPMNTGFSTYFYETLGGIKPDYKAPGFKEFIVNPVFQKELTQTSVSVPTPYGNIENAWEVKNGEFKMILSVPFNTKAKVSLALSELETLKINGSSWTDFKKANKAQLSEGSILVLGSGDYEIQYVK